MAESFDARTFHTSPLDHAGGIGFNKMRTNTGWLLLALALALALP